MNARTAIALLAMLVAAPLAADEELRHWRLDGGGEVIGRAVKETESEVYIDLGPKIVAVPRASVLWSGVPGTDAADGATSGTLGLGAGSFDPATGTVLFHERQSEAPPMTKTEILDRARQSVVLISNPKGAGSGFVLDDDGRIATNHHVIAGETYHVVNIFVKTGSRWERKKIEDVEVESFSTLYDIAVLKIDKEKLEKEGIELHPLELAPARTLEAGDPVYVIGNPGIGPGRLLEHTISEGIVSNLSRNFGDVIYMQTTAAVNPGNSGGPMLDVTGRVVGLVTLKASYQEGIAFALPVALMRQYLDNAPSFAVSGNNDNKGFRYLKPE